MPEFQRQYLDRKSKDILLQSIPASLLSQGSRSSTANDKSVTGPKNPTKLTVSLMRTACIHERGTPMTLFGITLPQALGSSLQCFPLEQQQCSCTHQRSPSMQPWQAHLSSTDYSCQKHNNLPGRTVAEGREHMHIEMQILLPVL